MKAIESYIEHTALKPTLVSADIDKLVKEAKDNNLFGVCVPPFWVERAKREIGDSNVALVTVIGFPLGYNRTETKLAEIEQAIKDGADELDIVLNISAFKDNMEWAKIDLAKCNNLIHKHGKLSKVIIETAYLSDEEIKEAAKMCVDTGTDIVKTSTGFAPAGAKVEHVRLIKSVIPEGVGIKASGGIRTKADAVAMIEAGADRLGVSSGVEIVNG